MFIRDSLSSLLEFVFPYLFRGSLELSSKSLYDEIKISAAIAIANLARERVPDEVVAAMGGERHHYGREYIIPSTFDTRLISIIQVSVAKAAMKTGVASKKISKGLRILLFLILAVFAVLFAIGGKVLLTLPLTLASLALLKLKGLSIFQLISLYRLSLIHI